MPPTPACSDDSFRDLADSSSSSTSYYSSGLTSDASPLLTMSISDWVAGVPRSWRLLAIIVGSRVMPDAAFAIIIATLSVYIVDEALGLPRHHFNALFNKLISSPKTNTNSVDAMRKRHVVVDDDDCDDDDDNRDASSDDSVFSTGEPSSYLPSPRRSSSRPSRSPVRELSVDLKPACMTGLDSLRPDNITEDQVEDEEQSNESDVSGSQDSSRSPAKPPLSFIVNRSEDDYVHSPKRRVKAKYRDPLRLQIASDLHIEMLCGNRSLSDAQADDILDGMIVPSAPYLVLAGDIGCPGTPQGEQFLRDFLRRQSERFEAVFYVAGNHEYYSGMSGFTGTYLTVPEVHDIIKEMCSSFNNVIFLDRKAALINGVRLVGATLWTDVSPEQAVSVSEFISDYRHVYLPDDPKKKFVNARSLTVQDVREWHQHDRNFLERQIKLAQRLGEDVVVITHHSPSFHETSHSCHLNSPFSTAFSTSLDEMMKPPVLAWIYGHTHFCTDQRISESTRLVANQKGYFFDAEATYRNDFVIAI